MRNIILCKRWHYDHSYEHCDLFAVVNVLDRVVVGECVQVTTQATMEILKEVLIEKVVWNAVMG